MRFSIQFIRLVHSDQTGHNVELKITGSNFPRAKAAAKITQDTWNISAINFDEYSIKIKMIDFCKFICRLNEL